MYAKPSMKRTIKILLFVTIVFQFSNAFAQQGKWAKDSLTFYENSFWTQIARKDTTTAVKTINYILDKGSEDLDAKFFDFFSATLKRQKEIAIPQIIGALLRSRGTLEFYRGDIKASKEAFKKAKILYSTAKTESNWRPKLMSIIICLFLC
jgi:hypothetical protein